MAGYGGNLGAGLLQGFVYGRQMKEQRAREAEDLDLKKRALKLQEDQLKLKNDLDLKKQQQRDQLISGLLPGLLGQQGQPQQSAGTMNTQPPMPQQAPPTGPNNLYGTQQPVQAKPSLTGMIAQGQVNGQLGGFNNYSPIQLAAIQEVTGIPVLDAGKLGVQRQQQRTKEQELELNRQREARQSSEMVYEDVYNPQKGIVERVGVPKFGPRPALPQKPELEFKILENKINELPALKESASLAVSSMARMDQLGKLVDAYGNDVTGFSGAWKAALAPIAQGLGINIQSLTDAQLFKTLVTEGQGSMRMDVVGPGPVSEYEQKLLKQVNDGSISAAEGVKRLLAYRRGVQERKIDAYNETVTGLASDPRTKLISGFNKPIQYKKGITMPQTDADYKALPSGAIFIDPDDGKQYRKP